MALTAVFLGAFSLSSLDRPWCALPAGACATFLTVGAVAGWCPTQLLVRRDAQAPANTLGDDEARQPINNHSRP